MSVNTRLSALASTPCIQAASSCTTRAGHGARTLLTHPPLALSSNNCACGIFTVLLIRFAFFICCPFLFSRCFIAPTPYADVMLHQSPERPVLSPPAKRSHHSNSYQQSVQLQRLLVAASQKESIRPAELSGVARAFCELEECKRKLKMKPLPKAVDVNYKGKRGKQSNGSGISD